MALVQDVAAALVAGGYATALGADLFAYNFPDLPHNAVCIIPLAGAPSDHYWHGSSGVGAIDYPGIQIQVRNVSKSVAETLAERIRIGLDGSEINNHIYCWTTRSWPSYLGEDAGTPRHRFSVDFRLAKSR